MTDRPTGMMGHREVTLPTSTISVSGQPLRSVPAAADPIPDRDVPLLQPPSQRSHVLI